MKPFTQPFSQRDGKTSAFPSPISTSTSPASPPKPSPTSSLATIRSFHLSLVHARCRPDLRLPAALYASTTLKELELRQLRYVVCVPNELSFPHLKTLYLESSAFVTDVGHYSFLKEPFSGWVSGVGEAYFKPEFGWAACEGSQA